MSYRWEKEPNGDSALVIDGWENGIAADPYSGLSLMTSVDLETPGEVAVGYPVTTSTLSGGGSSLDRCVARSTRYFTYGTPGVPTVGAQSYAIVDQDGRVWESTTISGTWTYLSSSNTTTTDDTNIGLAYWLGYLWKFQGTTIYYWNGSTWATFKTDMTTGVPHFAYVATNNQLYFGNGKSLGRIFAPDPTTFAPGTASTYSYNLSILQLPVTDMVVSIAEVGSGNSLQSTLLIGGAQNAIYPWDKVSTSFSLPIYVADWYIGKLVSANQNAFILPGKNAGRGRIYITNGSQADLWFKIPDYAMVNSSNASVQDVYYLWGDAIFHRNNLVFGFKMLRNTGIGSPPTNSVWAIDFNTKAFRSVSTLSAPSTDVAYATCLLGGGDSGAGFGYIVGWDNDGSPLTANIGYSGTQAGIGTGTILTDLLPVGTFLQKKTFTQVEFKLRTPLASGESISMIPIVDSVAGTALSFQPTVTTGSISGVANQTFQGCQWLQFQVSLTGNSQFSGARLREIRLR